MHLLGVSPNRNNRSCRTASNVEAYEEFAGMVDPTHPAAIESGFETKQQSQKEQPAAHAGREELKNLKLIVIDRTPFVFPEQK